MALNVLHKVDAKMSEKEGFQTRCSPNWMGASRGDLLVTEHALVFPGVALMYDEMKGAVLFSSKMFWCIRCYFLCVPHEGKTYTFAFMADEFWDGELPFAVVRESSKMGYSPMVREFFKKMGNGMLGG